MQPHPPQLPTQDPKAPVPRNLKRGALFVFVAIVLVAGLIAFLLPKKLVEGRNAPVPTEHRTSAQAPGFSSPAH